MLCSDGYREDSLQDDAGLRPNITPTPHPNEIFWSATVIHQQLLSMNKTKNGHLYSFQITLILLYSCVYI